MSLLRSYALRTLGARFERRAPPKGRGASRRPQRLDRRAGWMVAYAPLISEAGQWRSVVS
jgi:hypothetical protein